MKLEIDLMNPDEVAAGLVLLGRVGEAQREVAVALKSELLAARDSRLEALKSTPTSNAAEVVKTCGEHCVHAPNPGAPCIAPAVEGAPPCAENGGPILIDPASVFGGSPVTVPLPPTTAPLAVTVPSVPTPPILGAVTSGAAVELDKAGLPWDSRIHSSSKNKLANGMWKVARGKAPEYVKEVEAELRGVVTVSDIAQLPGVAFNTNTQVSPPVFAPVPPVPTQALDGELTAFTDAQVASIRATAPPAPIVVDGVDISKPLIGRDGRVLVPAPLSPVEPPPVIADPTTFETLMTRVSPAIVGGILPATAVVAACTAAGLASVVTLQSSPQFVPMVWATLKSQFPGLQ